MLISRLNDTYQHDLNETSAINTIVNTNNHALINGTNETLSSLTHPHNTTFPNSIVIIFVLSILSLFGVCFMIFGPLQRSEAYKRVENFTFGRHPIFNVDHREQSTAGRYEESMEFADE